MATPVSCTWSGVFPAATTQFNAALEVDLPATQRVQKGLLNDGVHGLVLMGTVGEGNSLSAEEKRRVLRRRGRSQRTQSARDCRSVGVHDRGGGKLRA